MSSTSGTNKIYELEGQASGSVKINYNYSKGNNTLNICVKVH